MKKEFYPVGIVVDALYEVRRVLRRLKRLEKVLAAQVRSERGLARARSEEWREVRRVFDQEKKEDVDVQE